MNKQTFFIMAFCMITLIVAYLAGWWFLIPLGLTMLIACTEKKEEKKGR